MSKEVIDARQGRSLFDRSHAKNQSTVAIDGLTISCRRERRRRRHLPSEGRRGDARDVVFISNHAVPEAPRRRGEFNKEHETQPPPPLTATQRLATIEDLPPIPTVEGRTDTLLALFHALFFVTGGAPSGF